MPQIFPSLTRAPTIEAFKTVEKGRKARGPSGPRNQNSIQTASPRTNDFVFPFSLAPELPLCPWTDVARETTKERTTVTSVSVIIFSWSSLSGRGARKNDELAEKSGPNRQTVFRRELVAQNSYLRILFRDAVRIGQSDTDFHRSNRRIAPSPPSPPSPDYTVMR